MRPACLTHGAARDYAGGTNFAISTYRHNAPLERIREGGEIRHAMVTVADVTPRVLLAQQLKESQQRMERQAELLLSVMHVEPQMLRELIEDAHSELETINALLREGRSAVLSIPDRNTFYRHLADDIFN